jgi:NAD(P)H-hydrate epimerase
MRSKFEVLQRGSDMALAAHFTNTPIGTATTVETVRFERPHLVEFRLLRGPVPHVRETFELLASEAGTELTWKGELETTFGLSDGYGAGRSRPPGSKQFVHRSTQSSRRPNGEPPTTPGRLLGEPIGSVSLPLVTADEVPWLSVEQMREVDRIMVEEFGISLVRMMENAGRNLAELARHFLGGDAAGQAIVVLVGPGGNGGGGLVAARHLALAGANIEIALAADDDAFAPVPAEQLAIARLLPIAIHRRPDALGEPALVLDALLGYSQHGDPRSEAAELIRWSSGRRVVALDVPSGLELASGEIRTPNVVADATMTLAAPKSALAAPGAAAVTGRLFLADISVPGLLYERLCLGWQTPFARGPLVELDMRTGNVAGDGLAHGLRREHHGPPD